MNYPGTTLSSCRIPQVGPIAAYRNAQFLKLQAFYNMDERPITDVILPDSAINDGDFLGVIRLDGLDPTLAWAMGAHTGEETETKYEEEDKAEAHFLNQATRRWRCALTASCTFARAPYSRLTGPRVTCSARPMTRCPNQRVNGLNPLTMDGFCFRDSGSNWPRKPRTKSCICRCRLHRAPSESIKVRGAAFSSSLFHLLRFNATAAREWFLNTAEGQPCMFEFER